ncbi:glucose-6-phosphate isomerase [Colwellia sp. MB3u-70]|uniref:glucose-6-phosphate isomerase n=1 Tax=unclassified Colwellia TaxID=196834 RepID=UPI0015F678FB|nr:MULTISPECIES: glucose-6-phosphate isomerase [unclassified Colwellia]MBA6292590.1 glucose-6-phosphate isomerase [Colwellia sp. MB3u-8]MBA6307385.1 glucose-6-phosphate isomerase [Colwellia sp. MB3u-70]
MDVTNLSQFTELALTRNIFSLFADCDRSENYTISAAGLFLDYAKQNIVDSEFTPLFTLAEQVDLAGKISAQFSGEKINTTEQRAVLHTVLRAPDSVKFDVLGAQADEVINTDAKMAAIVDDVHSGKVCSVTGEKFTDILAIGIGGSYYGVKVALSALVPYHQPGLKAHVLANVDGDAAQEKFAKLNAATTLVVVVSKTFTTQETLLNATIVKAWMLNALAEPHHSSAEVIAQHWYAVSSNIEAATAFGLNADNILPMWDWVGGRFSLWSAVGLPLALIIGNSHFNALKAGAYAMDEHFKNAPFEQNMPVMMALLGIWNRNALGYPSLAILPYNHALRALPGYLQQTDMESNGKSVSITGKTLNYLTAPVVFGQEGTNGQHAFMQLMHQSADIIPTDFILSLAPTSKHLANHDALVANCFAQSEALMQGKTLAQAKAEMLDAGASEAEANRLAAHKTMKGNTPSNTILMQQLDPHSLGALLALYEHKIFVQGVIWQINSYDQWGVELGKQLGKEVLNVMAQPMGDIDSEKLSASSLALIRRYKSNLTTTI